ncbi:MAG: phospho-N-acetylmuramoyl-pentapeptide-transferase [Halanaerobiaceae bacterium]
MEYFIAVGLPFFLVMILGPLIIKLLKKFNFGQHIREEGPQRHLDKEGIPTMGGLLIITGILLTSAIYFPELSAENGKLIWVLILTLGMGLIGFFDDYLKLRNDRSLGLKARGKIIGQIVLASIFAIFVYLHCGSGIILPFSDNIIVLGKWIIPLIILTVIGTANAVNLTDGLDGLAAGVTAITASSFALILVEQHLFSLALFALMVTGACLGFSWFNSHPAQVFMGDVGSMALGGALAGIAVISRTEIFLLIIGGVYVLETISVIIQVVYFKLTGGKRVFRMTPLHHHYELQGLSESKIVARFLIISLIFAALGLLAYYF